MPRPFMISNRTTKTGYLQLIDRGILTMDTVLSEKFPPLAAASHRVLDSFDAEGKPVFVAANKPITVKMMLNQTSGFGMEFGPKVQQWKTVTDKGKGYVNSCKIVSSLCDWPRSSFWGV